ncbi:glutamate receptor ionotropic, delta-2 [Eurosta solidaginis]|uniref:glutamate receptor ionotropic, delta-2 n=1 Tax=Eurosta solidaginis TaxID=178769 RepID=UPI00353139AE
MDIILSNLDKSGIEGNGNYSLALALAWVILNVYEYAEYRALPLIISQYANDRQHLRLHADLIQTLMVHLERRHYRVYILEQEKLFGDVRRIEWGGSSNSAIWFVDSWNSFQALSRDLDDSRSKYKRNGWFILIYTGTEKERLETVKRIFTRFFELYVININVFLLMDITPFAFTYFPFTRTKCHSAKPELLFSFHNNRPKFKVGYNKFFPTKVNNFHGCELSVVTWHSPPFMIFDRDEESGAIKSLGGIEGMLIAIISELMNFSIRTVDPEMHERGDIYENGTLTGVTKMINQAEANITIIFFMYELKRAKVMDTSFSYMSFPLLVAIPHGRPLSPIQRLYRPFKYIIWSLIGSNIILAIIIIYALKLLGSKKIISFVFGNSNRYPFSNFWASIYGGVIHTHLPYRNFSRYILGLWLLCTLVLRAAYTGQLYTILQDGRALTPLQTFQEIVDRNFTVNTVSVLAELLSATFGNASLGFTDGASNSMPNIMKRIARGSKECLTIVEPALLYYNYEQENEDERVAILPQKLIMTPLTMYMCRHSYLIWPINRVLLELSAVGIIDKFRKRYILSNEVQELQEPVKLTLYLLFGIFGLYVALMLLCTLVFILELWTTRSHLAKLLVDFLNY